MPFQKGHQKFGGRTKGTPNKASAEIKRFFAEVLTDERGRKKLLAQYRAGKLPPQVLTLMCHYVMGRPPETIHLEGGPKALVIDLVRSREEMLARGDTHDQ